MGRFDPDKPVESAKDSKKKKKAKKENVEEPKQVCNLFSFYGLDYINWCFVINQAQAETPMPEVGKEKEYWLKQELFSKEATSSGPSGFSFGFGASTSNSSSSGN